MSRVNPSGHAVSIPLPWFLVGILCFGFLLGYCVTPRTSTTTPMSVAKLSVCWITAPTQVVAESIASTLVEKRLAACVNLIPNITSVYTWEGKVNKDSEVLLMAKTQTALVPSLVDAVKAVHPYDVPEVISAELGAGLPDYMKWVVDSTGPVSPAVPP
eukprot:PhM_4_TR18599/c0_g2_i1/m.96967/K03926/cutA; periplasmic divalent cation tolerance protein